MIWQHSHEETPKNIDFSLLDKVDRLADCLGLRVTFIPNAYFTTRPAVNYPATIIFCHETSGFIWERREVHEESRTNSKFRI